MEMRPQSCHKRLGLQPAKRSGDGAPGVRRTAQPSGDATPSSSGHDPRLVRPVDRRRAHQSRTYHMSRFASLLLFIALARPTVAEDFILVERGSPGLVPSMGWSFVSRY